MSASYVTQYQVSFAVSPTGSGTTNPGATAYYAAGTGLPVSATANSGYAFSSWSSGGASITFVSSTLSSTTATISGPGTITANFSPVVPTYGVTFGQTGIPASVPWGVTVGGTHYAGTGGSIAVTGMTGVQPYSYDPQISGATGVQYVSSCSGSVSGAGTQSCAYTTQYQVSFAVSPTGSGVISPSTTSYYPMGAVLPISAVANQGQTFSGWTATGPITFASSTSASTTATISGPGAIVATFVAPLSKITLPILCSVANSGPSGIMTLSGSGLNSTVLACDGNLHNVAANASSTVTITAPPSGANSRYLFAGASQTTTASTCKSGTCPSTIITAYYQLQNAYAATPQTPATWDATLSILVTGLKVGTPETGCSITTAAGGGDATCSAWFDYNTPVSMPGSLSVSGTERWGKSGGNTFTQTTGGNTNHVNYLDQFLVSFAASSGGAGTVSPSGTDVWENTTGLTVIGTPNAGYAFDHWSASNGAIVFGNANAATTTVKIAGAGTLTANFVVPAQQPTSVVIACAKNLFFVNETVKCTAAVSYTAPQPPGQLPGGAVSFILNGTLTTGTCTLQLGSCSISYSPSQNSTGSYSLVAEYQNSDGSAASSHSNPITLEVLPSISVVGVQVPVNQGQNTTVTVTVSVDSGAAARVFLTATGLPPGVTATFDPPSGIPPFTSIMTVNDASATKTGSYPNLRVVAAKGPITLSVSPPILITPPSVSFWDLPGDVAAVVGMISGAIVALTQMLPKLVSKGAYKAGSEGGQTPSLTQWLRVVSEPAPGVPFTLDGKPSTKVNLVLKRRCSTPFLRNVGATQHTISVPHAVPLNGTVCYFVRWEDGSTQLTRQFEMVGVPTTLALGPMAGYARELPRMLRARKRTLVVKSLTAIYSPDRSQSPYGNL